MRYVALALVVLIACKPAPGSDASADAAARNEVRVALASYAAAARAVDADASAAWFTDGGTLFEPGIPPIISRDTIRAFVKSFPGVQVDSSVLHADTVEVFGTTAYVWGSYYEALRFPGQPPSTQDGRFVMQWLRESDGTWRIHRYYRVPMPSAPVAATTLR